MHLILNFVNFEDVTISLAVGSNSVKSVNLSHFLPYASITSIFDLACTWTLEECSLTSKLHMQDGILKLNTTKPAGTGNFIFTANIHRLYLNLEED